LRGNTDNAGNGISYELLEDTDG